MNGGLASLIGRPDLAVGGTGADLRTPRVTSDQPGFHNMPGEGDSGITVGRIAGVNMILLVIALGGFYLWTRSHQR